MKYHIFRVWDLVGYAVCIGILFSSSHAAENKPNVLFLLVDDLGWRDLGCQGSTFYETPNIDALARDGVRFTQAYAAHPKCVGSRMGLMMGKYPARVGNPGRRSTLPLEEKTVAEAFKENGYSTFFTGKWHLGGEGLLPQNQGFDINKGGGDAGMPPSYFHPYNKRADGKPSKYRVEGFEDSKPGDYLTDRLTRETLTFLKERDKSKPFFAYVSFYAVHEPIEAKPEKIAKYEKKLKTMKLGKQKAYVKDGPFMFDAIQDQPVYAAMLESVDESVGKLIDYLSSEGLQDNTIVVFTSDNGGKAHNSWNEKFANQPTSNLPLRAAKSLMHDGGIRIPMIVRWPAKGRRGVVSDALTHGVDHYVSLLDMAGLPRQPEQHLDSVSYVDALMGTRKAPRPALFWNFPQTAKAQKHGYVSARAIRDGNFKLIEFWQVDRIELYDLSSDPSESNDLSKQQPGRAQALRARLQAWVKDTDAPTLSYGK